MLDKLFRFLMSELIPGGYFLNLGICSRQMCIGRVQGLGFKVQGLTLNA